MGIYKSCSNIRTGVIESIENENIQFWVKNNILYSRFTQQTYMNIDQTKSLINLRHKISNGQKQFWLYDMQNLKDFPKIVRDYNEKNGQDLLYATAALVHSHTNMFIVTLLNKIKNPNIPFKAFKNEELAINWLNKIKERMHTQIQA
jgi:hypothetical protein